MIELIAIGNIDDASLEALKIPLEEVFDQETQMGDRVSLLRENRNQHREQYLASLLLAALHPPVRLDDRVLGVVGEDIFAPGLNFVFGEAEIEGKRALISIVRLRQEFYGLPKDENLFRKRVLKEAVHEIGHTYQLGHCENSTCVMHFSNSLHDTDLKGWNFCHTCQKRISLTDT